MSVYCFFNSFCFKYSMTQQFVVTIFSWQVMPFLRCYISLTVQCFKRQIPPSILIYISFFLFSLMPFYYFIIFTNILDEHVSSTQSIKVVFWLCVLLLLLSFQLGLVWFLTEPYLIAFTVLMSTFSSFSANIISKLYYSISSLQLYIRSSTVLC